MKFGSFGLKYRPIEVGEVLGVAAPECERKRKSPSVLVLDSSRANRLRERLTKIRNVAKRTDRSARRKKKMQDLPYRTLWGFCSSLSTVVKRGQQRGIHDRSEILRSQTNKGRIPLPPYFRRRISDVLKRERNWVKA